MATIDSLLDEWRQGNTDANTANQQRLDEILALLQGQGESAIAETRRSGAEQTAAGDQSLMDRGLFNTTILDSQRRRQSEATDREVNRIGENVALNKAGVLERVTDSGPDFGALLQLAMQLGQGQGGAGGQSFSFGGVNRPDGPINPFGSGGGGVGGGGGGGGGGGSNVYSVTNSGGGGGNDPFASQSIEDLQAGAQGSAGNTLSEGDANLPTIPRTVWFMNDNVRVSGDYVYHASNGSLLGRKGN